MNVLFVFFPPLSDRKSTRAWFFFFGPARDVCIPVLPDWEKTSTRSRNFRLFNEVARMKRGHAGGLESGGLRGGFVSSSKLHVVIRPRGRESNPIQPHEGDEEGGREDNTNKQQTSFFFLPRHFIKKTQKPNGINSPRFVRLAAPRHRAVPHAAISASVRSVHA